MNWDKRFSILILGTTDGSSSPDGSTQERKELREQDDCFLV